MGERTRPARDETEAERHDRQLDELLGELRVTLPGVQVLFAFLLTVPFSARFAETTEVQRGVYFATLLSTATATALLMAPTALHRMRFRQGAKGDVVRVAHRLTLWGLGALALSMVAAILLVTDVLFDLPVAAAVAAATAVMIGALWWALPMWRRRIGAGS